MNRNFNVLLLGSLIAGTVVLGIGLLKHGKASNPTAGPCGSSAPAESIVADDIASGRLVEVLNEWTPSYPGYCLYYPGRRHMAASLRAFIDLAQKIVSRNRAKAS